MVIGMGKKDRMKGVGEDGWRWAGEQATTTAGGANQSQVVFSHEQARLHCETFVTRLPRLNNDCYLNTHFQSVEI